MTVRETSILAFNAIIASGFLNAKREEAYKAAFYCGPGTASEIGKKAGIEKHALRKRLSEMVQMRVIAEVGKRLCTETGMTVLVYDVADCTKPVPLPKSKSQIAQARERIAELENQIEDLAAEVERLRALLAWKGKPARSP